MMGRIVIAVYRPRSGQGEALKEIVREHLPLLRNEGLVTDRKAIIMMAKDGSIIEVFEWKSAQAIDDAHENKRVMAMWAEFSKVCDYVKPAELEECNQLFSEFEPLEL